MIHNTVNMIDKLNLDENFIKREVASRVVSVALTALCCLEAACYAACALTFCSVLAGLAIVFLSVSIIHSLFEGRRAIIYGCAFIGQLEDGCVSKLCKKTIYTAATIPLTPFVGLFSPNLLVALHTELGTASRFHDNKVEDVISEGQSKSRVQTEINSKFLCWYTDPQKQSLLEKSGLSFPKTLLLYGPSKNGKKAAVDYIAKKLKMTVFTYKAEEKLNLDNRYPQTDIIYLKNRDNFSAEVQMLEKKGFIVVASLEKKDEKSDDFQVQIEVPLPDAEERSSFWEKKLLGVSKEDIQRVTTETDGCTLKRMNRIAERATRAAVANNETLTADKVLEALKKSKSSVGGAKG